MKNLISIFAAEFIRLNYLSIYLSIHSYTPYYYPCVISISQFSKEILRRATKDRSQVTRSGEIKCSWGPYDDLNSRTLGSITG